jgi:hypothetical protein
MAKKSKKPESRKVRAKEKVSRIVDQVAEPLSLLNTLKEEGLANAMAIFGMASAVASGATRNFKLDALKPQIYEIVSSLGFALKEDVEKLEARIEELETKIAEKEFDEIRGSDEE